MRRGLINVARSAGKSAAVLVLLFVSIADQQSASASGLARQESGSKVRIGVLALFLPHEFRIAPIPGQALVLQAGPRSIGLENISSFDSARVQLSGTGVEVTFGKDFLRAASVDVSGRNGEPADFLLAVPNKITRRYRGTLEIRGASASLAAVVTMDLETAVASVVAAESAPDSPLEALKAQAVATRGYFVAGRGRHRDFDFCDTTHCQFLREPPAPGSRVTQAVAETRGLVLAYNSMPFAPMYTRSCSGHTRTPAQLGFASAAYPYYSVDCKYCLSQPERWTTRISADNAATLRSSDESSRLNLDRRLGWSTVPSNDFISTRDRDEVFVQGTGRGHGIGLCQSGSKAMAEAGASFREILRHYYPNTTIIALPGTGSTGF